MKSEFSSHEPQKSSQIHILFCSTSIRTSSTGKFKCLRKNFKPFYYSITEQHKNTHCHGLFLASQLKHGSCMICISNAVSHKQLRQLLIPEEGRRHFIKTWLLRDANSSSVCHQILNYSTNRFDWSGLAVWYPNCLWFKSFAEAFFELGIWKSMSSSVHMVIRPEACSFIQISPNLAERSGFSSIFSLTVAS